MQKLKILVVRNDKIGDFMLAWPAFALLKNSINCHISALVPAYTKQLAGLCPSIDSIIEDPGKHSSKQAKKQLVKQLKQERFDAVICFFSDSYNASIMWKAGIKQRWAPATKIAQLFYNHRLIQRRSKSLKPEYQYNLDLAQAFIEYNGAITVPGNPPWLSFDQDELDNTRQQQARRLQIDDSRPWLLMHVGCGGSANNLSARQYAQLVIKLNEVLPEFVIVITAGPGEEQLADKVIDLANGIPRLSSGLALTDFAKFIANAQLFIAGSTGPLHLAAAIDVPTVGFFPMIRSSTPLRWQPINSKGRHLAFSPQKPGQENDMTAIDIDAVADEIGLWVGGE